MKFNNAYEVDQICWQWKQDDYERGKNRQMINDLFNGRPPYTDEEARENGHVVNVNFLEQTKVAHDARAQFYAAFNKPGAFFKGTTDMGPRHRRQHYSATVSTLINKIMKRSLVYFETLRSQFALDVLHGIGPYTFKDRDHWCPDALGIEDVFLPGGTLLTMQDVPYFAVYRRYTAPNLIRMTQGPRVDPGWNMAVVKKCLKWIDEQGATIMGGTFNDVWSPERTGERIAGEGSVYGSDALPTIDCFDFYFLDHNKRGTSWKRRMIIDSWSPASDKGLTRNDRTGTKDQFIFNSGDRRYGCSMQELIGFQFADLSCVGPFRYDRVRSLGFLLYGVCHLQNRLRCRFDEAVFESLMNYLRVKSADEAERALKVELVNRGILEETVHFVPREERWQVDHQLVELGLRHHNELIASHSSGWTQSQDFSKSKTEKTKFQVMAELNATTSMVSAGLGQAYKYHSFQLREIFRRFMKKNSPDPDVREFRAKALRRGVPEEILSLECWDIEPERIMGGGNKSLELAIAEQLMAYRNLYDPEPQREILRDVTLAITDDPARSDTLVPPAKVKVTDARHDAQLASAAIMMGLPVDVKTGMNHIDYVEALMANLAMLCKKVMDKGGVPTPDELIGLQNMAQHIAQHIQIIAQDRNEQDRVRKYGDDLGQLLNFIKGFKQRLMEQMKAQQEAQQGGQMDAKDQAKIQATMMKAQVDNQLRQESHSQRTAQRQIQFEKKLEQDRAKAEQDMAIDRARAKVEIAAKDASTAAEISRDRMQAEVDRETQRKNGENE